VVADVTGLTVRGLDATDILDSRGRPTLEVTVTLVDGRGTAGVPAGASTGSREAVELRDGDASRYGGLGVQAACANVTGEIAEALVGRRLTDLRELDRVLVELDGTPNKARLGANAVVGVSLAAARAVADSLRRPLWQVLATGTPRLPVPHFNVVNGGVHAPNPLDFQEFMIAPLGAPTMPDAVRAGAEIYARLRALLADAGQCTGLGDEGGFAPDLVAPEDVLTLLVRAITDAGYETGRSGVAIALDPAASEFCRDGSYRSAGSQLSSSQLIDYYEQLIAEFPIWSIEDGLAENDWAGWRELTDRLGDRVQLVGDDIFVTDPAIIERAVRDKIANAALIKPNQIGTVTETLDAVAAARDGGFAAMVSHRSGETSDSFIADLAVGCGCGQLKSGAPARGERVAKYNRILRIAQQNPEMRYGLTPPVRR
jgi:enolase